MLIDLKKIVNKVFGSRKVSSHDVLGVCDMIKHYFILFIIYVAIDFTMPLIYFFNETFTTTAVSITNVDWSDTSNFMAGGESFGELAVDTSDIGS